MSLSLYMDQHVRSEITEGLRGRHIDVMTAQEDGHDSAPDPVVLQRATQLNRILFSQDSDMLAIASDRQRRAIHFSGIVYAHQLGVTIGQSIADLELICKECAAGELENGVIYLPLQ